MFSGYCVVEAYRLGKHDNFDKKIKDRYYNLVVEAYRLGKYDNGINRFSVGYSMVVFVLRENKKG